MMFLGNKITKPTSKDCFLVGLVTLFGLICMLPLKGVIAPETIVAMTFCMATGSLLSAIGINANKSVTNIIVIAAICLPAAALGHLAGLFIKTWV